MQSEHDDDLEPEVIEGAEVETETYGGAEEVTDGDLAPDVTNQSGGSKPPTDIDEEESEASDTI